MAYAPNTPGSSGGGGDGAILDGASATIKATVKDYTNANPLTVIIVDTNGDVVAGGSSVSVVNGAGVDAVNIQDGGNSITVDGTVSVTEPVSVDDNGGSLTVDGVFFQATQPISAAALPLPLGAATAALQTQPGVDVGDVTVNNAAGASAVNIQDGGNTITVDGAVTIANLDVALSTRLKPADTLAAITSITNVVHVDDNAGSLTVDGTVTANLAVGANNIGDVDVLSLPSIPAGANNIGDVDILSIAAGTNRIGSVRIVDSADADLTSAKLTQTSRAVGVQELKDAGRTNLQFYAVAAAAGTTTTETAITLTKSADTGATSTGVSFVITNGKRFRITSFSVATRGNATATIQTTTFNLRINTAGAVVVGSTPIVLAARSATPATASAWDRFAINIGDGIEFTGNGTIQFGITAAATYVTNAPTWDVTITGFEY